MGGYGGVGRSVEAGDDGVGNGRRLWSFAESGRVSTANVDDRAAALSGDLEADVGRRSK
jgi:hypothetical protein